MSSELGIPSELGMPSEVEAYGRMTFRLCLITANSIE